MVLLGVAQMVASVAGTPADCLAPLTTEERKQDDAARASRSRAGDLLVLEPDEDHLPAGVSADFKPQLVTLSYLLGADGRVSDCLIDNASEINGLNLASCGLLRRHYRVDPGANSSKRQKVAVNWTPRAVRPQRRLCVSNGGAVPVSSDRWITSNVFSGTRLQAGSALIALDVGPKGNVVNCSVRLSNISTQLQRNLCKLARQRAFALPAVDDQGRFVATTMTTVVRFAIR